MKPSLFGLDNSNRDFSLADSWGKNQFNSSFPAALCNYMHALNLGANYINISDLNAFSISDISISDVYRINPSYAFFNFESAVSQYAKYIVGSLPRTDLVVQDSTGMSCISGFEVKLTALPDNTTCEKLEHLYGSEIVVRPDTIVYLACSIAESLKSKLPLYVPYIQVKDWSEPAQAVYVIKQVLKCLYDLSEALASCHEPFLIQPIWKTNGKKAELSDNCLDVFVWSNAAFTRFIAEIANPNPLATSINRQTRTAIWLYKMLYDITANGKTNSSFIINNLAYMTKNDKAFASSGNITNKYMVCSRLLKPAIHKNQIKEIILGGGHLLLSPERRFDALIVNTPNLF